MAYLYDLTDTWNAAGTVFNAIKMNVTNTASAAGSKIVSLQVGSTDRFTVDKDGNGYFSGTLQAVGSISSPNAYISGNSGTLGMQDNSASILAYNGTGSGGITNTLRFITAAAERVRIDASGNVGIGTSSPGAKLDVNGTVNTSESFRYGASYFGTASDYFTSRYLTNMIFNVPTGSGFVWARNGGDTMTLDTSGNLGLGVTPSAWTGRAFQVGSTSAFYQPAARYTNLSSNFYEDTGGAARYLTNGFATLYSANRDAGIHAWYTAPSGTAGTAISFTQAMTLDASGNLLVGTTTPAYSTSGRGLIEVNGSSSALIVAKAGDTARGYFGASATATELAALGASQPLLFTTNGAERARIDSSGNLLVGTAYTNGVGWTINPNGSGQIRGSGTTSSDRLQFANDNGVVGAITTSGTSTTYSTSSDARLKKNIAPANDAASLIDAIQVRQFNWKADGSHQRYGFVAQELLEVAPEAVSVPADEDQMMGVDYSKLVPMLVKEIQSLRARVAQLEGN